GYPAHRHRFWVRLLFGVRLQDIDSKFKLLRRQVFDRFPIQSDGDFVHAEIIAKINFLGALMDELPIAAKPGSYAAVAEPPPMPPPVATEMKRVFRRPVFLPPPGPNPAEAPAAPQPPPATD